MTWNALKALWHSCSEALLMKVTSFITWMAIVQPGFLSHSTWGSISSDFFFGHVLVLGFDRTFPCSVPCRVSLSLYHDLFS